ncbi:hypothetical protein [Clostridium sp.]|uniref:hypothetical protein n=1 Tax=Clostridium sp. TaxID=1506 RepID=UPI00290354F1|nr:hypothetical protein [Clostridium sp.]MDU2680177.1 hypothetical protein [Clostridium sp.]
MKNFNWEEFKNGEIAVHCDTEEKANNFLNECDKQGIAWTDGDKTTEINCWFWYEKNTSYACRDGKSKLTFEFLKHYKDKGLEIIKWEIDKMKELTFKEVIANIKEGEVWENGYFKVELKGGSYCIGRTQDQVSKNIIGFVIYPHVKFKLQRKEYTFQEAFKAYKEGRIPESAINGQILDSHSRIDMRIIEGKWYINEED